MNPNPKVRFVDYLPMLFCMTIITFLSHQPGKDPSKDRHPFIQFVIDTLGPHYDKWIHMGIYFVLGLSAYKVFQNKRLQHFLILTAFGLLDEYHQFFIPGRHFDLYDWLADSVGIALSILAIYLYQKKETPSLSLG